MSQIKRLLLCTAVACCIVAATLADHALAAQSYFVAGKEFGAMETVGGNVSTAILEAEWAVGTKIQIECTKNTQQNASINENVHSAEEIVLNTCELSEIKGGVKTKLAATCKVMTPITLKIQGLLSSMGGKVYNIIRPASGAVFGTVTVSEIAPKCGFVMGAAPLEGGENGTFGKNGEIEEAAHEQVLGSCPNMTLEKKKALFEVTLSMVKLTGKEAGKNWSAQIT